jgi:hypothetical protein
VSGWDGIAIECCMDCFFGLTKYSDWMGDVLTDVDDVVVRARRRDASRRQWLTYPQVNYDEVYSNRLLPTSFNISK